MISLSHAATRLEYLCEEIDFSEVLTDHLKQDFDEFKDDLGKAVDRRISYIKYCESQIDLAMKNKEEWYERALSFRVILERIKKNAIETIRANPNLPYKGQWGALRVQKNSKSTLIVEDEEKIDDSFFETEMILNKGWVREAIEEGKSIEGARLELGEHLRVETK